MSLRPDRGPDLGAALFVVAATLYGEADPQNPDDAEKIAAVICNRAWAPSWWGTDLVSVCLADKQFTCWNWLKGIGSAEDRRARERLLPLLIEGDPMRPNPEAFRTGWAAQCLEIATVVVAAAAEGGEDSAKGATHYFATYLSAIPSWAKGRPIVAQSRFRSGRHGHDFYLIGPGAGGVEPAPRRTPIPRDKPLKGAAATGAATLLGALADLLASGGESLRAIVGGLSGIFRGGPQTTGSSAGSAGGVPIGAFLFLCALLLFSLGWMLWIRWSEVRTWTRRWPWEDSPEAETPASVAPPAAPEPDARWGQVAEAMARQAEVLERLAAALPRPTPEPEPPKTRTRRAPARKPS